MTQPYKNDKQLAYAESLCKRPLVFQHAATDSYPEIEVHIEKRFTPSLVKKLLEPLIEEAGFTSKHVTIQPYDHGERGYNELVVTMDLMLFSNEDIKRLIRIVLAAVKPYASLTDVETAI